MLGLHQLQAQEIQQVLSLSAQARLLSIGSFSDSPQVVARMALVLDFRHPASLGAPG